jgi:hypothetical protein
VTASLVPQRLPVFFYFLFYFYLSNCLPSRISDKPYLGAQTPWHPLYQVVEEPTYYHGEIVADNEFIRTLLQWIAKPDNELNPVCGNTSIAAFEAN